jgi:hypothetical protein
MNARLALILLGMAAGACAVRGEEQTNRAAGSRDYTNRVQLYQVDLNVDRPSTPGPADTSLEFNKGASLDAEIQSPPPAVFVPAARPVPAKRNKKKENWIDVPGQGMAGDKKEKKESGWGWLADDVNASKEREHGDRDDRDADADEEESDDEVAREDDAGRRAATAGKPASLFIDRT